jgi:hypothetical protein
VATIGVVAVLPRHMPRDDSHLSVSCGFGMLPWRVGTNPTAT